VTVQPDPQLIAAVDEAMTAYRDQTPVPEYGSMPPVPQPGRPPMSQRAVDVSTMMLSAGAATIPPGAVVIGVMLASGHANPTVIAWICSAPAALAVPILAIARVLRRVKDAAPDVHNHHYAGPVHQQHTHNTTRGVWAKNINQK
jgi:hypothetical protein